MSENPNGPSGDGGAPRSDGPRDGGYRDRDRDGGGGGGGGGGGSYGGGGGGGYGGGGGGYGGDREGGGFRRDGERRERGPMTVKGRLRAKARKKARKSKKKGGSFLRKKVCRFCTDPKAEIDYRDPKGLRYFITETGKLIPMRISGNCAKHQRAVAVGIKRARQLATMPYAPHHGN